MSLVSVIVPTYNSGKYLEACLLSVKNQSYSNIELIVVDKNSTDDTVMIARKYTDKIFFKEPERSAQRNFGVEQARGDYVFILDSDMVLSKNVVAACVKKVLDDGVRAVVVPEESFGVGFWAQCKRLERSFYVGVDWMEAARFFERKTYLSLGGFNETMVSGEDWDLSQRFERQGKIGRIDDFIFHNEHKISLFRTIKKKYYYAGLFSHYTERNKNSEKLRKQTSILNRYKLFFSQPKKLFQKPLIGVGMLFMKTCEFVFGGAGFYLNKNASGKKTANSGVDITEYPLISFIIPTLNAAAHLERCLVSIRKQSYPIEKMEVIVVDGGSTDATLEIARKFEARTFYNKQIIAEFGKSIGIKASRGEYFILLDADNEIVETDWLQRMVAPILAQPELFGVESRLSFDDKLNSLNRYFARLRIADPLAKILADRPTIEMKKTYAVLKFASEAILITGANGFLWNKAMIMPIDGWQDTFEEANISTYIHELLGANYAVPFGVHVRHYYCDTIWDYLLKRKKIAVKIKQRMKTKRYVWVLKTSNIKIFFSSLYLVSVIGPSVEAVLRAAKDRTMDWLWHPVISCLTIFVYAINFLKRDSNE